MKDLTHLADLIRIHNFVNGRISTIIGRPANTGSIGEYIGAEIFDIALATNPVAKAIDGHFRHGDLAGRSVNIKFYSRFGGLLDMASDVEEGGFPDFYLVLSGPKPTSALTHGTQAPLVIDTVYLLDSRRLLEDLLRRPTPMMPGIATSIRKHHWESARIHPGSDQSPLVLSDQQRTALALLAPVGPS